MPGCSASYETSSARPSPRSPAPTAGGGPELLRHLERNLFEPDATRGSSRRVAEAARGRRRPRRGRADRPQDRSPAGGGRRSRRHRDHRSQPRPAGTVDRPDTRAPRHPPGARGEHSACDDRNRVGPVRAPRHRIGRGVGGDRRFAAAAARPRPASAGGLAGALGPQGAHADRGRSPCRMGAARGEDPRRIWALDGLAEAGDDAAAIAGVLTRFAADVAEKPHSRSGLVPSGGPAIELRAATEVARALAEIVWPRRPRPQRRRRPRRTARSRPGAPLARPD